MAGERALFYFLEGCNDEACAGGEEDVGFVGYGALCCGLCGWVGRGVEVEVEVSFYEVGGGVEVGDLAG